MRKITSIFALLVVFVASCLNENEFQKESIFKADVLNYLGRFKESINDEGDQKIDELIEALDFRNATIYAPKGKEELLIVDISSLNGFEENQKLKAIFFIDQDMIVRSSILALTNHTKADELIISFFNAAIPKNYSGKISIYSILQSIEFFSVLENGQLRENGNINGSKNKSEAGKTNGCIDWYLVTTYYYGDGSRRTTEYFMYTTCDCEEQNSRMGRVSCGEGGTGGATPGNGSPAFPTNPQHGDIYEYRYPDGKITFWQFSSNYGWARLGGTLPEATVQSSPLTYPYLLTDGPTHGLSIIGPDNFLYVFNAFYGIWTSGPNIVVNAPQSGVISNITEYLKCFLTNASAKVTIYVDQPDPGTRATWAGNIFSPNVGHTFVAIEQGGVIRVFGFYPSQSVSPVEPSISSVLVNDSAHPYDVSIEITVTANQLTNVINTANSFNSVYNLNSYNCTDFGISIAYAAGVSLPDSYGSWINGGGSNPGDLGQDLRSLSAPTNTTIRTAGGTGPSNSGTCN